MVTITKRPLVPFLALYVVSFVVALLGNVAWEPLTYLALALAAVALVGTAAVSVRIVAARSGADVLAWCALLGSLVTGASHLYARSEPDAADIGAGAVLILGWALLAAGAAVTAPGSSRRLVS